jgi:hypothetical protein
MFAIVSGVWYGERQRKGAIIPQPKTMAVIEAMRPDLIKRAIEMCGEGDSDDAISRMFTAEAKTNVGREMVRAWRVHNEIPHPKRLGKASQNKVAVTGAD